MTNHISGRVNSLHQTIKTTQNHFKPNSDPTPPIDYDHAVKWLSAKGIHIFGSHFKIHNEDILLIKKLIAYFLRDEDYCIHNNINFRKGILLSGPVGSGKTSLMVLMRYFQQNNHSLYTVKSCRDISFEFIKDGYKVIYDYSKGSYVNNGSKTIPLNYCFDDLGTENNLKYYGNECNIMAEIILSRYDLFISKHLLTHITTNLSASEIESMYGDRVRSRMREMFNLITFDGSSLDKRK